MMQARSIKQFLAAGALTLAVSAVWMPGIARAQDDSVEGNSIWNLERRVWGGIVRGLGLRDPNAPEIDYRERSPLVVPPSRDLPPPQTRTVRDPAWPKDPDVARTRKANEAKRKSTGHAAIAHENQLRPVTPDELNKGTSAQSSAPTPGGERDGNRLLPSELGYFGGLLSGRAWGFGAYKEEVGTFTAEPPRQELTAPPPGYQTPSPEQPYGNTRRIERTPVKELDPGRP